MNRIILLGRLVRDPSLKYTDDQRAICKFCIAVDKPYKAERAEDEPTADFIPCTAFGSRGEAIAKYFKQGDRIALQGRLNTGSYMKNDEKRYSFNINVENFEFCQNKKNNNDVSVEGFHQDAAVEGEDLPF